MSDKRPSQQLLNEKILSQKLSDIEEQSDETLENLNEMLPPEMDMVDPISDLVNFPPLTMLDPLFTPYSSITQALSATQSLRDEDDLWPHDLLAPEGPSVESKISSSLSSVPVVAYPDIASKPVVVQIDQHRVHSQEADTGPSMSKKTLIEDNPILSDFINHIDRDKEEGLTQSQPPSSSSTSTPDTSELWSDLDVNLSLFSEANGPSHPPFDFEEEQLLSDLFQSGNLEPIISSITARPSPSPDPSPPDDMKLMAVGVERADSLGHVEPEREVEHDTTPPQSAPPEHRFFDLDDADLDGADLNGADLDGADLDGADLDGADLDALKRAPHSSPPPSKHHKADSPTGFTHQPSSSPSSMITIAIAGGKGGVGRSMITANLALSLTRSMQKRVIIADLDPNGGNLHTYLGLDPEISLPGDILRNTNTPVLDQVPGYELSLCRGLSSISTPSTQAQKVSVIDFIRDQRPDVILLDLGNHPDAFTLDAFLSATHSVITFAPNPCAIERGYTFLKRVLYRQILDGADDAAVVSRALLVADQVGRLHSPEALLRALENVNDHAAHQIRKKIDQFSPKVIMNRCRTQADRALTHDICHVISRRWRIRSTPLGAIDYDESVTQSLIARKPLIQYSGTSVVSDIDLISRKLFTYERESVS